MTDSTAAVFIWAPTQRCGTGLLQRLVTSSGEVLVFGEERHLTSELPAQLLHCSRPMADQGALRDQLASGDPSGWFVHVYPPAQAYREVLVRNFRAIEALYAASAREHGFGRWGSKYPAFRLREAQVLSRLLPGARHLFIYRDIVDVLRSIKARGWLTAPSVSARYCAAWSRGVSEALGKAAHDDAFRLIRYEDLISSPADHLPGLASFLGVQSLDPAVFAHRVNAPGPYRAPLALTAAERAPIAQLAGAARAAAGYAPVRLASAG